MEVKSEWPNMSILSSTTHALTESQKIKNK